MIVVLGNTKAVLIALIRMNASYEPSENIWRSLIIHRSYFSGCNATSIPLTKFSIRKVRRSNDGLQLSERVQPHHHAREWLSDLRIACHDLGVHFTKPCPFPVIPATHGCSFLVPESIARSRAINYQLHYSFVWYDLLFNLRIRRCEADDPLDLIIVLSESNADARVAGIVPPHYCPSFDARNLRLEVELRLPGYRPVFLLAQEQCRACGHRQSIWSTEQG
jgi:hypothetical protein